MTGRVLVTGASGFIGRHAVHDLQDRGWDVHTVGRSPATNGAHHHTADLLDPHAIGALLPRVRPSHLLHLAWDVTHGAFWESRSNLDWVAASLHLYRAFVAAGGRTITVAGTCAEYDWSADLLGEATPLNPATLYGVAKNALHAVLRAASAKDGVALGWGRIFLLYGPHEGPDRLVSGVARRLLRGEPAPVGNGDVRRDVMHVADVAAALATLLEREHDGAVNIATGDPVTIRDVTDAIGAATGRPELVQLNARPSPPGEKLLLAADASRLRALGFRPRIPLVEGIAEAVAWWAERP